MSVSIKKLNKLKSMSRRLVDRFDTIDPLSVLSSEYVSASGLTKSDLTDKIDHLRGCSDIVELREHTTGDMVEHTRGLTVGAANFCKQHCLCPVCADRMQARRRARFNDPIKAQAEMVERGQRYAYMVTYTVTDGPDLRERLDTLRKSKRAFTRMGQKRGKSFSGGEASKIKAAISTTEIKRGKNSGEWHVHCHDLVFTDEKLNYRLYEPALLDKLRKKYGDRIPEKALDQIVLNRSVFRGKEVPVSKMSREWLVASGGDSINIDVSPIRHIPKKTAPKKRRILRKMSYSESITYQAKECLKYPFKPDLSRDPGDMLTVLNDTYNRRMTETFGAFRGVSGDDYIEPPENEVENLVMVWKDGKYTDAIPGAYREKDESEDATDTRRKAGKLLGEYRRKRREIVELIPEHPDVDFATVLDDQKEHFRRRYTAIWSVYRSKKALKGRQAPADTFYSSMMALQGIYVPDLTLQDVAQQAFS